MPREINWTKEDAQNAMGIRYPHLFLDVDGTVTASRSKITTEMYEVLSKLNHVYDIVFISGASMKQMETNFGDEPKKVFPDALFMCQNGNVTPYWNNKIENDDEIMDHVLEMLDGAWNPITDLVEHRGSQISLSMIGHHAPIEIKKKYDPDAKKRKALLKRFPFKSDKFDVVIAGTTCFDYFLKGMNKGANIKRMIELKSWKPEDCLYIGDSLFKGGNDETVKGVIPTKKVKDENETLKFLKSL